MPRALGYEWKKVERIITNSSMTVMSIEWMRELKRSARRRNRRIRKERGIQYGDGYSIRFLGRFCSTENKAYYVYEISNIRDRDRKTGLRTFDLFTDDLDESYRPATYDEMMEIMHGEWFPILED